MAGPELDLSDLTAQAVDNLVTQFSSSLDFYRELIQNSIDAGSATVDVWTEFIPSEEGRGTIAIHIDDSGEGMNEEIIDKQLTRLFSSKKEGDLTKIGKFGIGFVSVFACKPEAVLIHTGRDGEHWEVCFSADRSFVKGSLGEPVDGTQITVFLAGDRGRYGELVAQSKATLKRWCAHSDIEVTFEDRSAMQGDAYVVINEPFAVPGECLTEVTVEGTAIVAAYSDAPVYGFYNKGLALAFSSDREQLLGGHGDRFERIAFKVKSRYLEHTLSRDTVVQDANFQRVMRMVRELAAGQLLASLVAELAALATAASWDISDAERYLRLLAFLAGEPIADLAAHSSAPLLRTVDGAALSLDGLWDAARADGQIYISDQPSELSAALAAQGTPVLFARRAVLREGGRSDFGDLGNVLVAYLAQRSSTSLLGRARSIFGYDHWGAFAQMLQAPEDVFLAVEPAADAEREAALIADADALLQEVGAGYRRLVPCRFTTADRDPPLFVVARAIQPLMAAPPPTPVSDGFRLRRPEAAVNVAHPQVRALLDLRALDRPMAAYCLAKDLLLAEDRKLDLDPALIAAALPGQVQRFAKEAR
ncbi:MAG: ATP-binding protein [Nannocystaceae bacterium]